MFITVDNRFEHLMTAEEQAAAHSDTVYVTLNGDIVACPVTANDERGFVDVYAGKENVASPDVPFFWREGWTLKHRLFGDVAIKHRDDSTEGVTVNESA